MSLDNALIVRIEKGCDKFEIRTFGENQTRQQVGHVSTGGLYPVKHVFGLPKDQLQAYAVGEYLIHPSSFRIGKYDKLELNPFELRLVPIGIPSKAA